MDGKTCILWKREGIRVMVGLPRWLSGKESTCQCRTHRFDPWVGKIPWRRKWLLTPIFLPGEPHGQRSLAGYSPWSRKSQTRLANKSQLVYALEKYQAVSLLVEWKRGFENDQDLSSAVGNWGVKERLIQRV